MEKGTPLSSGVATAAHRGTNSRILRTSLCLLLSVQVSVSVANRTFLLPFFEKNLKYGAFSFGNKEG